MAQSGESKKPSYNYGEPLKELRPEARELLVEYAKVSEDDMIEHVNKMVGDSLPVSWGLNINVSRGTKLGLLVHTDALVFSCLLVSRRSLLLLLVSRVSI